MKYILALLLLTQPFVAKPQSSQQNKIEKIQIKEFLEVAKIKTNTLIEGVNTADFEIVNSIFNSYLLEKLDANKLEQTWNQLEKSYGKFQSINGQILKQTAERNYLLTQLDFEKESFDLEMSLDENDKVNSLMILPAVSKESWKMPDYVNAKLFISKDTSLGGEYPLLANWVYPREKNKEILVVMVHGSGPNDMDESLGPNKIFKDIAYGLASNGIASLRYNKRTYDYRGKLATLQSKLTIDMEVVDDAVEAVKMAKTMGYKRVFVLGHSLGGHMAPKISQQAEADGVIVMAGNVSPLHKLLVPQYEYLMENDKSSGISNFQIEALKEQVKLVESGSYTNSTHSFLLPLGLPGSYWTSLQEYNPQLIAKKQAIPYLILNGTRDYQVNIDEAKAWKDGSKNKLSKTIIYKGLNHAFFYGTGICLPAEYEQTAHVDEKVIMDISSWLKSL